MSRVEGSNRAFFQLNFLLLFQAKSWGTLTSRWTSAGPAAFDLLEGPGSIGKGEGHHDKEFKTGRRRIMIFKDGEEGDEDHTWWCNGNVVCWSLARLLSAGALPVPYGHGVKPVARGMVLGYLLLIHTGRDGRLRR